MRKIVANEWVSLDGVIQAPGTPEEDPSGGFSHGGWHIPFFDDISRQWVVEGLSSAGGFLFGRRTYEILSGYWPHASEEEQVIARPLNTKPKYVASTALEGPLSWDNAHLLEGDVAASVRTLKAEPGEDLHILGSSQLLHSLAAEQLVDVYRLMIDPLVLGGGKGLFGNDGVRRDLELTESQVTSTGALLVTYTRREG